ncbi:hypothetical protein OCK74_26825 [Chitinophagaceae bacterium LB-8]|uniref:HTH luxR-type domain-containing protein n=1 Tax=Paraflavisolibacter caeni TaxID=2982496 RepID=A0A9X2Y0A2_9BACT|nr:triple tyrosine motif-containing protein [Paraflavisolibacter caeni]MCU7552761.1 hypothetical protein [Paraflavisolibacter caeni]
MPKFACLLFFCFLFGAQLNAQNTIGVPNIINYPKELFKAGSQNWNIAQDKNGIMYFANNYGLLSFDGAFWRTYELPNKTIVRSVSIAPDGRVYVGGQAEFGYFFPDKKGELTYTSLTRMLPEKDHDFADVWNVILFQDKVFFRSNKQIIEYDHHKLIVHHSINWNFLGTACSRLLAYEYNSGLVTYQNGKWKPFIKLGELPRRTQIRAAIAIGQDSILLPTEQHGFYLLKHDTVTKLEWPGLATITDKNPMGACLIAPDKIAVITNLAGCFIINKKGEIIQRFSKQEGIQNNNILSVFLDQDKNLWLGLDNGIDLISYSNAIKNIYPDNDERNAGYTSIIHDNHLYMGVSTGLYKIDLDYENKDISNVKGSFSFVENSKGQVWGLSEVNGRLLMGHNRGAFLIDDNNATVLDNKTGFWFFQPLYKQAPSPVIVAGTYNGVRFYECKDGVFLNPSIHSDFESARLFVIDDDNILAAHPYKGLYIVNAHDYHAPVAKVYLDKKGVLSSNHNKIFRINGKIILTSDKGIFEFDRTSRDFVPATWLAKIFENITVSYLTQDKYGNIWFCSDKKIGIVDRSTGVPKPVFISELNDKIVSGGYEHINVIDSNNIIVGAEKGFFHINYAAYQKNKQQLQVLIRKIQSPTLKNGLIFGGYGSSLASPGIRYQGNSLHFEFSTPFYGQRHHIEYSYYLSGFDKGWSAWSDRTEKDYTNLPAGNYIFKVKCRNNETNESVITAYSFTILPPWYQSWWAYTIYALLLFSLLYLFYKRQQFKYKKLQELKLLEQQRKYDEEQKQLQYQHQLEMEQNEKEIIRLKNAKLQAEIEQKNLEEEQKQLQFLHQLEVEKNEKEIIALRNEKLQSEVDHKNSELASSAMNLVRKMEMLSKLKADLVQYKETPGTEKSSKEFQKIIKTIDKELDHDHEWEQFAIHFDNVHTNYLKKLKEQYPDLTASELKLAAYLRLSISTKEIAQLMNISVRGVETSRYRLRKKLGLSNETNLFDFLISVTN